MLEAKGNDPGSLNISRDISTGANQSITVRPGTQFRMKPSGKSKVDKYAETAQTAKWGDDLLVTVPGGGQVLLKGFYNKGANAPPSKMVIEQKNGMLRKVEGRPGAEPSDSPNPIAQEDKDGNTVAGALIGGKGSSSSSSSAGGGSAGGKPYQEGGYKQSSEKVAKKGKKKSDEGEEEDSGGFFSWLTSGGVNSLGALGLLGLSGAKKDSGTTVNVSVPSSSSGSSSTIPAVSSLTISDDTGTSSSDFITKTPSQTVRGTFSTSLLSGQTVKVSTDNGSTWTAATATTGSTTFSLSRATLSGSSTLMAKVVNTSLAEGASLSKAYVLDTTAPTITSSASASYGKSSDITPTEVIYTATATDSSSLSYSITGTDSNLFSINVSSGQITLRSNQSVSTPSDNGADGTYDFTLQATDAAGNSSTKGVALNFLTSPSSGQATIDLGTDGKLILPVQVEGNWYYYWDRSGNGTSANTGTLNSGTDITSFDVLDGIFNKSSTGVTNTTVQNADGFYGMTETYRFGTINGINLAVPTVGWNAATAAAWTGNALAGTAYSDPGPTSNSTTTSTYDDFLAIWDSQNGTGTTTGTSGLPAGWATGGEYITASPVFTGHYRFYFSGEVARSYDDSLRNVVLRVLPIVIDLNHDGSFNYGNVVMDVNGDGLLDATRWVGAQDGVLVWDKHHDGLVHDNSQYAFAQYDNMSAAQGKTATDLSGLAAAFDTNHDGVFDAQDAQFADFNVWQDANQDGVSDAGEVKTLAELGLSSFQLSSDGVARTPEVGVHEAGRTSATATDGSQVLVADVGFDFGTLAKLDLSADPVANTLALHLDDLLANPHLTLVVQGAANDAVKLQGDGWVNSGSTVTLGDHHYTVWSNSTAQLLIDQQLVNNGRVL